MCFDTQSSLLAWSITYSIGVYLYFRNKNYDRWNAAFIMAFATIQLLEAGIWESIYRKKIELNDLLTRLILLTLMAQPLIQSYMGYRYTKESILALMSWVFLGLFIWAIYRIGTSNSGQFGSTQGPHGHLIWNDAKSPNFLGGWWVGVLYILGLFIPLFFMKEHKGFVLLSIGVITAILSLLVTTKGEFSSYWCYTTVVYAIAALFV